MARSSIAVAVRVPARQCYQPKRSPESRTSPSKPDVFCRDRRRPVRTARRPPRLRRRGRSRVASFRRCLRRERRSRDRPPSRRPEFRRSSRTPAPSRSRRRSRTYHLCRPCPDGAIARRGCQSPLPSRSSRRRAGLRGVAETSRRGCRSRGRRPVPVEVAGGERRPKWSPVCGTPSTFASLGERLAGPGDEGRCRPVEDVDHARVTDRSDALAWSTRPRGRRSRRC